MPFYDLDGAPAPIEDLLAHLFGVFHDKRCNAVHQCVRQALLDGLLAPGQDFYLARTAALDDLGQFHQAFGGRTLGGGIGLRSEEQTSELQSLMSNSSAVFCLKQQTKTIQCKSLTN